LILDRGPATCRRGPATQLAKNLNRATQLAKNLNRARQLAKNLNWPYTLQKASTGHTPCKKPQPATQLAKNLNRATQLAKSLNRARQLAKNLNRLKGRGFSPAETQHLHRSTTEKTNHPTPNPAMARFTP
jgi:hypothetical protein